MPPITYVVVGANCIYEDIRCLPETAPYVHESYMKENFILKWTKGNFKAVGMDLCL